MNVGSRHTQIACEPVAVRIAKKTPPHLSYEAVKFVVLSECFVALASGR